MSIAPRAYQAVIIASALRLYAKTGIKANRAYTPTNMIRKAREITGKTLAARDYVGAAQALTDWANANRAAQRLSV